MIVVFLLVCFDGYDGRAGLWKMPVVSKKDGAGTGVVWLFGETAG
jgi:hypothetical protein